MSPRTRKEQIEALLTEDPNDPELRYALAMEYVSAGDDESAVRTFQELTAASPEYVPAYFHLARALLRLDRTGEARAAVERGVSTARGKGDLHAAEELQGLLATME